MGRARAIQARGEVRGELRQARLRRAELFDLPGDVGRRGAAREHPREARRDQLVVRRLGERLRVHLHRRGVVRDAHLVELPRAEEEARALLGRRPRPRQDAVRGPEGAVVPRRRQDARDLGVGHRMGRVDRARGLERLDRVVGGVQARLLDLREREPEGDLVRRLGDVIDPRAVRLGRGFPALGVLVQARLEGARGRVGWARRR